MVVCVELGVSTRRLPYWPSVGRWSRPASALSCSAPHSAVNQRNAVPCESPLGAQPPLIQPVGKKCALPIVSGCRTLPKHERLVDLHGSVIDDTYADGASTAVLLIMERLHRDLYTGLKVSYS